MGSLDGCDFVIVVAGIAGCVIVTRLSEDDARTGA
jgi:choline dehydrogenase-like flavoprotein